MEDIIHWPFIRLGKILTDMQPGFAQRPGDTNANAPQLRTNNVSPNGTIDLSDIIYVSVDERDLEKYRVKKGDVIFNNTNSVEWVGKTAYFDVEEPYVLSNHMTRLRVSEKLLDARYLAAYLHYHWYIGKSRLLSKQWVNQAAIDQAILSSIVIPLPPLPEQCRIAAILREADEIRKIWQETKEKAQKIAEALFYDMFGDPIKSKIGWERKKLSDFVDINSNLVQPTQEQYKGLWHIGSDNIESETGRILDLHTIAEVGAISSKFLFSEEHVLYSKIRPALKKVATPDFTGLCSADIYPISFDAKQVSKIFLAQLLRSNSFTGYTARVSGRAQIPKINREDLLKYETILPDLNSQKDFEKIVIELFSTQKLNEQFTSASKLLYQSLLSQAFTGELTASWRKLYREDLAQATLERDALLQRSTTISTEQEMPTLILLSEVGIEREDLVDQLSLLQRTLLDIFLRNRQSYFTANQLYEDHEEDLQEKSLQASLDQVRRELRTLAVLGLIREIALPVADQPGRIDYATVYRYPQPDDDTMSEDLELLATRSM